MEDQIAVRVIPARDVFSWFDFHYFGFTVIRRLPYEFVKRVYRDNEQKSKTMGSQAKQKTNVLVPNKNIIRQVANCETLVQNQQTANCLDVHDRFDHCQLGRRRQPILYRRNQSYVA